MPLNLATASDRPNQTIHAAGVFHDNAYPIALACADAADGELVVALVTHDHALGGIWTIPRERLSEHVGEHDNGGWTVVFSPGTSVEEIEDRCLRLARLAFARWETLRRWSSKHR